MLAKKATWSVTTPAVPHLSFFEVVDRDGYVVALVPRQPLRACPDLSPHDVAAMLAALPRVLTALSSVDLPTAIAATLPAEIAANLDALRREDADAAAAPLALPR